MTDDLVAFLRAQVAADERAALAVKEGTRQWELREDIPSEHDGATYTLRGLDDDVFAGWDGALTLAEAAHIARWDPARVLAEVQAKRRIIDLHEGSHECSTYDHNGEVDNCTWVLSDCSTLRLLALPFAGREGWRAEWAPDEEEHRG